MGTLKVKLRRYTNGAVVKIPNRRVVLMQSSNPEAFVLQFKNTQVRTIDDVLPPGMTIETIPAHYKVDRGRMGTLTLHLSREACYAALAALSDTLERLDKNEPAPESKPTDIVWTVKHSGGVMKIYAPTKEVAVAKFEHGFGHTCKLKTITSAAERRAMKKK